MTWRGFPRALWSLSHVLSHSSARILNYGIKNELNNIFIIDINNDFQWIIHPVLTFYSTTIQVNQEKKKRLESPFKQPVFCPGSRLQVAGFLVLTYSSNTPEPFLLIEKRHESSLRW